MSAHTENSASNDSFNNDSINNDSINNNSASDSNPITVSFDNSYYRELPEFYHAQQAAYVPSPSLIKFNHELAQQLQIDLQGASEAQIAQAFSGNHLLAGAQPLAQAYAGHQFGHYNPQLGDGRALLLGETLDVSGQRYDIQLKGSGTTPFSRRGDGKAALGPVLREYLFSEAMFALNVPTTRALSAVLSGESVWREQAKPGAILTRVASSHIRVGTFQFFAYNDQPEKVKQLADYVIARHFPDATQSSSPYLTLLKRVCEQQAKLVSQWQLIGFVHGVMNTDNTAICGETIDYGPCAFMDRYDPATVFSSIDSEGRYAYGNQPSIAQWNLARFAETILTLISEDEQQAVELATQTLHDFMQQYHDLWLTGMLAKLGITNQQEGDRQLIEQLLTLLKDHKVDYTQLFRSLSSSLSDDQTVTQALFNDSQGWAHWRIKWQKRLEHNPMSVDARATLMNQHNPIYIPRNHIVEQVIAAAEQQQDFEPFEQLLKVLQQPFVQQSGCEEFAQPAPEEFGPFRTFCGT
ncbi:protein adenylyltransferase SelO [Vibrio hippocampi]|uniref:Protein nucleotidyltransferase YdiU n=1 Tax=Vibrio hippocampi TaxID=654686 RepID=A0ABN8DLA2_9VIBR|nr:YdiU family protein [Vibrio hippocampi]CAH0529147.1 Protein adenylyltransferase SelO [Vibrio hippocampi]